MTFGRKTRFDSNWVDGNNPGTPDEMVPPSRRFGRIAARDGRPSSDGRKVSKSGRIQWYLGWYDVGLEKWYRNGGNS